MTLRWQSCEDGLTGLNLQITPTALTVPRGVATQLNTSVTGAETLPAGATVQATLRGPSFPDPISITAIPGEPLLLPGMAQPGTHFLENIRLQVDSSLTLPASPSSVTINVLDELLVGDVTSRPLTLEEIRNFGIEFDENSFQAFNFTIALTTESDVIQLNLPVLVPTAPNSDAGILAGAQIPGIDLDELPDLEIPNFLIEPIMLEAIEEDPPGGAGIPPIPGIMIIPGNIAFLNQFFSVMLAVSNQAPDGTPLVVRNVRAEIVLPAGADGVAGDILRDPPFEPGDPEFDNPLRIAKTADAGRENIKSVLSAGLDGETGTADDVDRLRPQESGRTEFLVEGVREGGHGSRYRSRGTLEGLPGGPVEVAGRTRGAVVVRDPNFSLTFIHPDTVRAGERYDLLLHIQNTSLVDANLVTVSLDPPNLSGARLQNGDDRSQIVETIEAGGSATVTFPLEALRTGSVTATSLQLTSETDVVSGRRLSLRAGVSEQGVPLSPDTLILPPAVGKLRERAGNDDLTFRAVALLGEAHSIATAPRGRLPAGVRPMRSSTVVQRANELSEAAFRLELSVMADPDRNLQQLPDGLLLTLEDLYFDFLGAGFSDDGWDSLYRRSRQARLFGAALAEVVGREARALNLNDRLALQRHWADTEHYRADYVTVMTQAFAGDLPVILEISDSSGRRLGGSLDPEGGTRDIPGADILNFGANGSPDGQFAVLTRLDEAPYTATLTAAAAGSFDLGIVAPGSNGELQQFVFSNLPVAEGETVSLTIDSRREPVVVFERDGSAVLPTSQEAIPDGPPQVLGILQQADRTVDEFGRVVAVLFDEEVDEVTAEETGNYAISSATIPMIIPPDLVDPNQVTNVRVQLGGRIVLLRLSAPMGPFVPRDLDVSGVRDLRGQVMAALTAQPILADPDIEAGGQVTGRVLRSDGSPVPDPEITYFHSVDGGSGCKELIISVKSGDSEGRYGLDFVLQAPCGSKPFSIRARDLETGEEGTLSTRVRTDGERLTLDLVLVGRGSVEGIVRDSDGTPLPDAVVNVTSATDLSRYGTRTDQNGFYRLDGIPVGAFGLIAAIPAASARASATIPASGSVRTVDVTLFGSADAVLTGEVRFPDGAAAPNIDVFLGPSDSDGFLAAVETDEAGTFIFDDLFPGEYSVRALDAGAGLVGEAIVTVNEANTTSDPAFVQVVLAGTGSVSGSVFERVGSDLVLVPGALVAGGTRVVTADDQGRYSIPAVPVGQRRINAASPATGARGSTQVTVLTAGQHSNGIDIVLEPLGTVTGRVFNPGGQPVTGQEVRILIDTAPTLAGGRVFFVRKTNTDSIGDYRFDQLELKDYPVMAVRGREVANGTARLSPLIAEESVDLHLVRPTGRISGRVSDETGFGVAAQVVVRALGPNNAGVLEFRDVATTTSDPDKGFSFGGLFPGAYTVTASSFFSPIDATHSGELPVADPVAEGIELVLPLGSGSSLTGCVLTPDGETIEPVLDNDGNRLPLSVFITSRQLRDELERDDQNPKPDGIRIDASTGCFVSSITLPPDHYTLEVTDDRPGSPTFRPPDL